MPRSRFVEFKFRQIRTGGSEPGSNAAGAADDCEELGDEPRHPHHQGAAHRYDDLLDAAHSAEKYWLFIILFFSLIGCAIYFFVEMLPDLMGGRTGRNLAAGAKKIIDPDRAWREAMTQVEISPTAHNKRVLADACVARGNYADAIALYTETLTGHDAHEPDLLRSRAGARLLAGDHAGALADLDDLRAHNPDYQSEEAHLIYARALDGSGRDEEALAEYSALVAYSTGEEARCRFALLLKRLGRKAQAQTVFAEILRRARHAPRHYRRMEREWIDVANANITSYRGWGTRVQEHRYKGRRATAMMRFISALAMTVIAAGLGACAGPDVISASERQIVLNVPDQDRVERHCRGHGKSAQNTSQIPLRITYACR